MYLVEAIVSYDGQVRPYLNDDRKTIVLTDVPHVAVKAAMEAEALTTDDGRIVTQATVKRLCVGVFYGDLVAAPIVFERKRRTRQTGEGGWGNSVYTDGYDEIYHDEEFRNLSA